MQKSVVQHSIFYLLLSEDRTRIRILKIKYVKKHIVQTLVFLKKQVFYMMQTRMLDEVLVMRRSWTRTEPYFTNGPGDDLFCNDSVFKNAKLHSM